MRILVATDAWKPQVNGVVRTLEKLQQLAPQQGLDLRFLTPDDFATVSLPGYPEIRLAVLARTTAAKVLQEHCPEAVHIATEGPIGLATRALCLARNIPFTTSYHTRFPEYLRARLPVPQALTYAWLRRFHNAGCGIMTATSSLDTDLAARGFRGMMRWSRGVDTNLFYPRVSSVLNLPRPIFLTVSRIAVEKNIAAFLALDLPGSKVVVGDGPALPGLRRDFPSVQFLGAKSGVALAEIYASADVFVFPSLTDTFGLVLIEALASGVPVAAYPVMGPRDIITSPQAGVLDQDLRAAALAALKLDRRAAVRCAAAYSWEASTGQFAANMSSAVHRFRRAA